MVVKLIHFIIVLLGGEVELWRILLVLVGFWRNNLCMMCLSVSFFLYSIMYTQREHVDRRIVKETLVKS